MNTVLIIDDLAIVREPIAAMLRNAGYRALCARNGREAQDLLRADLVDLILLDISMPEMDGLTFLRALRSETATARIPVIMLTGEEDQRRVMKAIKLGIAGYVLKSSFSLEDLLVRVCKQLSTPLPAPVASN